MAGHARQIPLIAVLVALLGLLAAAAPAGAAVLVRETGSVGAYAIQDNATASEAGAVCKYTGSPIDWFQWMRVVSPSVYAPDHNGSVREHRVVGWRVRLQRATSVSGPWTTTRTSPEERATAYDNAPAPLHPITVRHQSGNANLVYRALVDIRWYGGGSVKGSVVLRIQNYHYRAADANPDYVKQNNCANRTD
jgi:hypothetical protein